MKYQSTLYYPETGLLVCPGRMLEIDFIVAFLFMPISAGALLRDTQRRCRLLPDDWALVAPEAENYMPSHCVEGLHAPWRRVIRLTTGKFHCLVPVALQPVPETLISMWYIEKERRRAVHVYNDVCVRLALSHSLMRPGKNALLPPSSLYHDWFVVWAGLVKKYDMQCDNVEQERQNVERCRYLAEEEAKIQTMLGGEEAALAMVQKIVDTIEINFTNTR